MGQVGGAQDGSVIHSLGQSYDSGTDIADDVC